MLSYLIRKALKKARRGKREIGRDLMGWAARQLRDAADNEYGCPKVHLEMAALHIREYIEETEKRFNDY